MWLFFQICYWYKSGLQYVTHVTGAPNTPKHTCMHTYAPRPDRLVGALVRNDEPPFPLPLPLAAPVPNPPPAPAAAAAAAAFLPTLWRSCWVVVEMVVEV